MEMDSPGIAALVALNLVAALGGGTLSLSCALRTSVLLTMGFR
jgi:hypothetical protein